MKPRGILIRAISWEASPRFRRSARKSTVSERASASTTQAAFNSAATTRGVTPEPVFEIESREGLREAIIRGLGVGVISETEFAPHPEPWPLLVTDSEMFARAYIICLKSRRNRPLIQDFLQLATSIVEGWEKSPRGVRTHLGLATAARVQAGTPTAIRARSTMESRVAFDRPRPRPPRGDHGTLPCASSRIALGRRAQVVITPSRISCERAQTVSGD
ncbi:MAG: LysR family transcriptional regulator substrate-binding protein [Paracoccaceae bacterium]|nr:LysR family transcriptional regulator substrate-binding protein [Paracoccaceae bacterium]